MNTTELKVLLTDAIQASIKAGKAIMDIYTNADFEIEYKGDNSPLTIADKKAHNIIVESLTDSGIPVLSEEGKEIAYEDRAAWTKLWVVDPLDGTKEFIKQNGEFTVNIALVENQQSILGVIYVPVEDCLYFGADGLGSYRMEGTSGLEKIDSLEFVIDKSTELPLKQNREYTMVGSRSHMNMETAEFFEKIKGDYPNAEIISRGSSLKICMVAEGNADVYPRFAPTMEWDTAAGHAIVKQVGFNIFQPENGEPLIYNKEDLLNPWFIVRAENSN